MSNSYFQFKEFKVEQDGCAMKVSTDACIQGAFASLPAGAKKVLDVGTGTGLLSLMLAQRFPDIYIDAIETDEAAFQQARVNMDTSPWKNRMQVIHADARIFDPGCSYDFLICNPPFFSNSLKGPVDARNKARHDDSLSQPELISLMQRTLKDTATACFLWPAAVHPEWESLLGKSGFNLYHKLSVRDKATTRMTRVVSTCGIMNTMQTEEQTLIIKNDDGTYTDAFSTLLAPFYLYL